MNATDSYRAERLAMVREQIARRGIADPDVLTAMRTVPRHRFVPENLRSAAYADRALPLGPQQTISQPYIVARMTELAAEGSRDRALEVGTGSGYQAAVLAELFGEVHTIECDPHLAERARTDLAALLYRNVHVHTGDGRAGWPPAAPFDAIVVTAGTATLPDALREQLAIGGRVVYPHGASAEDQVLRVMVRTGEDTFDTRAISPVRFVLLK